MKHAFVFFLLFFTISAFSQSTTTRFAGNWNTNGNWTNNRPGANTNATIQHQMTLNTDINIGTGTYTVTPSGSIVDPTGGSRRNITVGNNGLLNITGGNVQIEGNYSGGIGSSAGLNLNGGNVTVGGTFIGGSFHVGPLDTLIVGDTELLHSNSYTIDSLGVLIINGDLDLKGGSWFQALEINCNGNIFVNGSVTATAGFLGILRINGSGAIQSVGSVVGNAGWNIINFLGTSINGTNCTGNCKYGGGGGLPIELLSFDASYNEQGKVELEWTTESEINNDYFIVEKSRDGYIFTEIDRLKGAGNSMEQRSYSLQTDPDAVVIYYRLTQVDFDGSSKTFPAVALGAPAVFKENEWMVYPNPARENETINVFVKEAEAGSIIEIRDMSGKLVFFKEMGNMLEAIAIDNRFTAGMYIVSVVNSSSIETKKLMISH